MVMRSTLSSKGQVTIPARVRRALDLEPGDRVEYRLVHGKAELVPARGNILDAAGSVRIKKAGQDIGNIRSTVKRSVAQKAARRGK